MDIGIYFFSKSIEKLRSSTIASHREVLISKFFRSDFFTFLLGRGIGGFEKEFGTYPHNVILNKWSDFGIVGLIWILIVVVVVGIIITKEKENKEIFLIILGASLFPFMFSFTYWSNPGFFLLEFLVVKYIVGILKRKRWSIKF